MSIKRKSSESQTEMWIPAATMAKSPGHPFYERLNGLLRTLAERENRPLSNFIETAASRYVESELFVDEFEMAEIESNRELTESLARGTRDAKNARGRFV